MIGRRVLVLAAVAAAALVLCGCKADSTPDDYRYKMTVEVDTPQGVKTASAVREIRFNTRFNGGFYGSVKGEAVVVDLPGGKTLFALLTGGDGNVDYAGQDTALMLRQVNANQIALWPDPPKLTKPIIANPLPMLVTFGDIRDPKSVEKVDPKALDKAFGPGVKLKRISIAVTDEPVTMGIGKRLGWFRDYKNLQLDGHRYNDSQELENILNRMSFSQGIEQ